MWRSTRIASGTGADFSEPVFCPALVSQLARARTETVVVVALAGRTPPLSPPGECRLPPFRRGCNRHPAALSVALAFRAEINFDRFDQEANR